MVRAEELSANVVAFFESAGGRRRARIVADLSIELIEKLRPLVPRIKARDKSLADLSALPARLRSTSERGRTPIPEIGERGFTRRLAALVRRWPRCARRLRGE